MRSSEIGQSAMEYWLRIIAKNLEQLNKVASSKVGSSTTTTTTTTI